MTSLVHAGRSAAAHRSNAIPIAVMVGLGGLLLVGWTESLGIWLLEENHPVELASFVGALLASIVSFSMLRQPQVTGRLARGFFLVFGGALFFLAMEEISWGQQFLEFPTPEAWRDRNTQDELTLHNYDFRGVRFLEIYPLMFAVGGIIGIVLGATERVPKVIAPPAWMWPWFVVIALHSGIDLLHEFYAPSQGFDDLVNDLDEAAEMLVAFAALTFVWARRYPERLDRPGPVSANPERTRTRRAGIGGRRAR